MFHLSTAHGTLLGLGPDGRLLHGAPEAVAVLTGRRLATRPGLVALTVDADAPRDLIWATRPPAPIACVQIHGTGARIALTDPRTGRFLTAAPGGAAAFDREHVLAWERFAPVAVTAAPGAVARLDAVESALGAPDLQAPLLGLLARGDMRGRVLAEALWPVLPPGERDRIGQLLLARPGAVEGLARLYPDDPWASEALPALRDFLAARMMLSHETRLRGPGRRRVGPERDHLARDGAGRFASFPHVMTAGARRSVRPRRTACVVASLRNEGIYLLEWLAHHRCLGFEHFFLYSNDNEDGSDALLGALAGAGIVTWIESEVTHGGNAQWKAYGHAFSMLPDILDYRWALVIDLDEYMILDPALFGSVAEFLSFHEMRAAEAIALNWVFMAPAPQGTAGRDPLTRRCRRRIADANEHIKSLVRTALFPHMHPHHPFAAEGRVALIRDRAGGIHQPRDQILCYSQRPAREFAWINHYFYKSAAETMWKFSRNRGDFPTVQGIGNTALDEAMLRDFMNQHDERPGADDDSAALCAPGLEAEIARLRALPGVEAAATEVERCFVARMEEIRRAFTTAPAIETTGALGERFLALADSGA